MSADRPHARRGAKAQRSRPSAAMRKPTKAKGDGPYNTGFHANVIAHAEALAGEVLAFDMPADVRVSRYFKTNPMLGHRDRGLIAESVFAVLRRKLEYAQLAQSGTGSLTRRMILLGLAEAAGVEPIAATLDTDERTWLRRVATIDRSTMSLATRSNLPEWLFSALRARFDEAEIERIAAVLNQPAPLDLRVNTLATSRDDAVSAMRAAGLEAEPTPFAPNGIRLRGKPALAAQKIFIDGRVEVQDEGSQLLASLVGPKRGELVIDFCAGAGGKTLALAAAMHGQGTVHAYDADKQRLAPIYERLKRAEAGNVQVHGPREDISVLGSLMDRVVVDAPCTGAGTWRRRPDAKWRLAASAIDKRVAEQDAALDAAARFVRPGGTLAYITCSLISRENAGRVAAFLERHRDFSAGDSAAVFAKAFPAAGTPYREEKVHGGTVLTLTPKLTGTDGFFFAQLVRQ